MAMSPKKNRILLLSLVVAAGAAVSGYLWWEAHRPREVVTTVNKDRNWHARFLGDRVSAVSPSVGGVRITGRIFRSPRPETRVVPPGYRITFPDDHGGTMYTISRVEGTGVVIEYESEHTPPGIGPMQTFKDSGSFMVAWREGPASAASQPDDGDAI